MYTSRNPANCSDGGYKVSGMDTGKVNFDAVQKFTTKQFFTSRTC